MASGKRVQVRYEAADASVPPVLAGAVARLLCSRQSSARSVCSRSWARPWSDSAL